jgi:hypothetical protein
MRAASCLFAAVAPLLAVISCRGQEASRNGMLQAIKGRDETSGIAYVRISLLAEDPREAAAASGSARPALTIECSETNARRRVDLYFDLGDADRAFHAPVPPDPVTHFLPQNPNVRLSLAFEGYKPFKRIWEVMPTHEYKYRVPGLASSNLEDVSFFLRYMYSVPVLRVSYADRKVNDRVVEFHTSRLIEEVNRTALCHP